MQMDKYLKYSVKYVQHHWSKFRFEISEKVQESLITPLLAGRDYEAITRITGAKSSFSELS